MSRYQIILTPDLEETYKLIAGQLDMSMEQVLSSVAQIYAEHLTLTSFDGICDVDRVRDYKERNKEALLQ